MIRIFHTSLIILTLIISQGSFANFNSHSELQSFIENYSHRPSPEKISDLIDYAVQRNLLYETSSRYSIVSFLVGVIDTHRQTGWPPKWKQLIDGYDEDNFSALSIPFRFQPSEYLSAMPEAPMYVDSLWGVYFGTGENKYLSMLMSVAASEPGTDINRAISVFSARASLANHSKYLPSVYQFLDSEKLYGGNSSRELAAKIISTDSSVFLQEAKEVLSVLMVDEMDGLAKQ